MSKLIEVLMEEHQEILKFTQAMETMCLELMEHNRFSEQEFRDAIVFIRQTADRNHHQKEERLLFKVMTEELGTVAINLIQHGMIVEHDQARLFVSELEQAVTRYAANPNATDKLWILANAMSYCAHLRRHIEKEDNAVYPFAARALSAESLAKLDEAFAAEQAGQQA